MQRLHEWIDRLFYRFGRQSDNRRAAILGMAFGLFMCVIVLLMCVVAGFVAGLGE